MHIRYIPGLQRLSAVQVAALSSGDKEKEANILGKLNGWLQNRKQAHPYPKKHPVRGGPCSEPPPPANDSPSRSPVMLNIAKRKHPASSTNPTMRATQP